MTLGNGYWVGFTWVHCGGESSYSSVCLASYHHPRSITWRWALYWNRPRQVSWRFGWQKWGMGGNGSRTLILPLVGSFSLSWQEHMFL